MAFLALALALAAAPGAAPAPPAPPIPVVAPTPVAAPAPEPPSLPAVVTSERDAPDAPADAGARRPAPGAVTPAPPTPSAAQPPPAAPSAPAPAPPLPQAAVEKLGQGDRAFLARDYRSALFAYQDAVYLAPTSAVARVRLGRAYLALRYPAQAMAQAEQALAADPASAQARQLLEDARNPPARLPAPAAWTGAAAPLVARGEAPSPAPATRVRAQVPDATAPAPAPAAAAPAPPPPAAPAVGTPSTAPQPLVFRFDPEAEAAPRPARRAPDVPPRPPPSAAASPAGSPAPAVQVVAVATPSAPAPSAAQLYRDALELLRDREFERAVAVLTQAIEVDPRLAVAHAARASARFGLGRYREATADYAASLALDASLGTPLYGLAECYRVLGDARSAVEMYERYASSPAADVRDDLRAIAARRAQELR